MTARLPVVSRFFVVRWDDDSKERPLPSLYWTRLDHGMFNEAGERFGWSEHPAFAQPFRETMAHDQAKRAEATPEAIAERGGAVPRVIPRNVKLTRKGRRVSAPPAPAPAPAGGRSSRSGRA